MVIRSEFRLRRYRSDNHQENAESSLRQYDDHQEDAPPLSYVSEPKTKCHTLI